MKKILFTAFSLIILLNISSSIFGQTPEPESTPPDLEEIIRISSKLVLIDALVLNKDNEQVKDLKPEDFEIYQDGKLQEISSFTYVSGSSVGSTDENTDADSKGKIKGVSEPPVSVRSSGQTGRVITFVVDDGNCLATPQGVSTAKNSVKKFIDEQMRPDDKVAIYKTRGGSSLLQMYSSNKEALKRIVKKVRWFPSGCGSAFDAARDTSTLKANGKGAESFESEETKKFKEDIADDNRENQVIGSLGVLGFVIERLKVLPERKIVFFISEGILTKFGNRAYDALREVSDKASRSSVVVYTMSQKGLTNPAFISAQDEVLPGITGGTDNTFALRGAREDEARALNNGMSYLAYSTGGKFIRNKNFLAPEIEKILEAETGYYLLGYQPEAETFKGKEYHKIYIKVKKPGLKVSSRRGFYGREEREARARYKNVNNPLYQAIASPFSENGIDIRLTTLIGNDSKKGNYIRSLFHIDGKDLTFIDDSNGMKKTVLDVVAVTLDEKGGVVEEFNRTYPIRIPERGVETIKKNGLDYSSDMPVKKSGFYSFRLAVRDAKSNRLASAGGFVQIPKMKKNKLFMSGLIATNVDNSGKPILPESRPANKAFAPVFSNSIASIRQYSPGTDMAYAFKIYNAKINKKTGKPELTKQIRLYKNGELLIEGKETPIKLDSQNDMSRIQDTGIIKLNQYVVPDEYILQVVVRDKVSKKNTSEWIDFEVIR